MTFCTKYSRVCFTDCSKFQTLRTGSRPKQGYLFGVLRTQISMFEKNRLVLDLSTAKLITTTEVRRQGACCFQTLRTNLVNTIEIDFGEYQIANGTVWHLVMPTSSFQIKRPPAWKKGCSSTKDASFNRWLGTSNVGRMEQPSRTALRLQ